MQQRFYLFISYRGTARVLLRLLSLKQLYPEQWQLRAAADFPLEAGERQVLRMT